jgi:DNA mismatch endonuclease, patch repair protein
MTDTLSPQERSALMSRVRGKDSVPEWAVRRIIHRMGYRYRLHARDLPGTPDIVFRKRRKAIFVHGCYWHRHPGCKRSSTPSTRTEFWSAKFAKNRERDERAYLELADKGWDVLVLWECEIRNREAVSDRLKLFLGHAHSKKP